MPVRPWQSALLILIVSFSVVGCSGTHYKFNDSEYRPLGDPQAINRGK